MSLALVQAGRLKPEVRLAQAISVFEASLSTEEKARINSTRARARNSPPSQDDVMMLTAEIDRSLFHRIGRGRCVGPRLTNFIQAVQQFAALGDVVVGGSQNIIACGVWALVRFSLLSLVNYASYLEKLSSLLMAVGRSAPRYQSMALLYPRSPRLQASMLEYLIVVVQLFHQAFEFTQKSTMARLTASLSDKELASYQSRFDLWINSIKEEANVLLASKIESEATENTRFRHVMKIVTGEEAALRKEKAKLKILRLCSTYDHEKTWKQIRKQGHATIFQSSEAYQDWRKASEPSTLLWTGRLGSGKSVLLANMVDDLHLRNERKDYLVSYFFCRHDISDSLHARTILGSLARQLLCRASNITSLDYTSKDTSLDMSAIGNLLSSLLPSDCKIYMVIDGLDECDQYEAMDLVEQLRLLQLRLALHICVSLRQSSIHSWLGNKIWRMENLKKDEISAQNSDLDSFVKTEIAARVKSKRLVVADPSLVDEIRKSLLSRHEGMFLWVSLQIDSLCAMYTDASIRKALHSLPKDLPTTFSRILMNSKGTGGSEFQMLILKLMVAARRPLITGELLEALSITPGRIDWDPTQLINDIYRALGCCGSLLVVDEEDDSVQLVHHSVKEYLIGSDGMSEKESFTLEQAEIDMCNIIVTYLSNDVFRALTSSKGMPNIQVGATPLKVIETTLDGSRFQNVALKFLDVKKRPNPDLKDTLVNAIRMTQLASSIEVHFQKYAATYWVEHLMRFPSDNFSYNLGHGYTMSDLLLIALKRKVVDVELEDEKGESPLWRSFRLETIGLSKILIESGSVNIDKPNQEGVPPLRYVLEVCTSSKCSNLAKLLIRNGANLDWRHFLSESPLHLATKYSKASVVKALLDKGADPNLSAAFSGPPMLWIDFDSSNQKHGQTERKAQLLLKAGATINAAALRHVLLPAVSHASEQLVKDLLIAHRIQDKSGKTLSAEDGAQQAILGDALVRALYREEKTCKEMFAHRETARNSLNTDQVPLQQAEYRRSVAIVDTLLSRGANINFNYTDNSGLQIGPNIIEEAVSKDYKVLLEVILGHGLDLQLHKPAGFSLLDKAVTHNSISALRVLLENGGATWLNGPEGFKLLHQVVSTGRIGALEILLKHGANIESRHGMSNLTLLQVAVPLSNVKMIRVLLKHGASLIARDNDGRTPLFSAVYAKRSDVVKDLMEGGAITESRDNSGHTPLTTAVSTKSTEVVATLLKYGANVDYADGLGRTPLLCALEMGSWYMTRLLLNAGAKVPENDNSGNSILDVMERRGWQEIVQLIIETKNGI